mmetsp:Transcript_10161/g.14595  ORF Transcript_10161/g.14595 Transcript_10161/m.14595 type:complete len:257 (+) Transcript_10161:2-772(+)
MNTNPTHVTLLRNYNYAQTAIPDSFVDDPDQARARLGLSVEYTTKVPKPEWKSKFEKGGFIAGSRLVDDTSRYPGSFRPLQREAMRKSTAAPTIFKPVKVKDEVYCDGGIVASNPTSIAFHEARTLFPDVPVEMIVSIGTGGFVEEKRSPRSGWDAMFWQILNSATDAEHVHHFMDDAFGTGSPTSYYRFNPCIGLPNDFPIAETDPETLGKLFNLTERYLQEPKQQKKLEDIRNILDGRRGWRKLLPRVTPKEKP